MMYLIDEFAYKAGYDKYVRSYFMKDGKITSLTTQVYDQCYVLDNMDGNRQLYYPNQKYQDKYKLVRGKQYWQARKDKLNFNDIDGIRRLAVENRWVPGSTIDRRDKTIQQQIDLPIPDYIPAIALDIEVSMTEGQISAFTAPITAVVLSYNFPGRIHKHKVWLNGNVYKDFEVSQEKIEDKGITLEITDEKMILDRVNQVFKEMKAILVTFNGVTFDIKYFTARCDKLGITSVFDVEHPDVFRNFGYENSRLDFTESSE